MATGIKFGFLSLKWKLSFALIGLSLGLVALYVVLATKTFESDKIAYVFETRQSQLDTLSNNLARKLERGLSDANSVLIGFDGKEGRLNPLAQKAFESQKSLLAVIVSQGSEKKPILQITKTASLIESFAKQFDLPPTSTFAATGLSSTRFMVAGRDQVNGIEMIRAIIEIPDALVSKDDRGTLLILEKGHLLASTSTVDINPVLLEELSQDRMAITTVRSIGGEDYLISSASVPGTEMKIVSLDTASSALGAIHLLYKRSLVFIAFSAFLTILISLALSNGLTSKLQSLTQTAGEIGKGDFSQGPVITSNDEVGVLQAAFARMSTEIQNLLIETKQKALIEEDLKTGRLVQESLFPEKTARYENFSVSGLYSTSTALGGDWWFHYQSGNELIVAIADATGHGTSAALVTAAARSLFSKLKDEDLSLPQIAKAWDSATAETTRQRVFMTALLLKINLDTGQGTLLNASHEAPILINPDHQTTFLDPTVNPALGEKSKDWKVSEIQMMPGERLLFLTDGLWAIESPDKKIISERRFLKTLAELSIKNDTTEDLVMSINESILAHSQGQSYPDDVTFVVIDRLSSNNT